MRILARHIAVAHLVLTCFLIGTLSVGLSGCGRGGSGRGRANRAPGSPIEADDLVGKWKLTLLQFPMEVDLCLVNIEYKDKKSDVKLVGEEKRPGGMKIVKSEIKDDGQVNLDLEVMGTAATIRGKLEGTGIWGTLMFPKEQLMPVKLTPSELDELDPEQKPEHMAGVTDFMNAVNSADKYVSMDEFVRKPESNKSPVLIEAYSRLAMYLKEEKLTTEQINKFIADYRAAVDVWGPRMAPYVDLVMSGALTQQKLEPKLARELIEQAEQKITADYPIEWKIQLADNWVKMGDQERALKVLEPIRKENPTHPFVRLVYAQAKDKAKDVDAALKEYATLAILPQFERMLGEKEHGNDSLVLPSEAAARLWKAKHDSSTKGLDDYLRTAYDDLMNLYVPERKVTKRPAKSKVILAELKTGSGCVPCVAVDMASEAVDRAFSTDELIVIRYHSHSPIPDPLANVAGMERADFYEEKGTPRLYINGLSVPGVGGTVMQVPNLAKMLAAGIDEELKKSTSPIEIKLAATRAGDEISIKATVSGIKTTDNDPRLILVLIENNIDFQAVNQVRLHNGVARALPAGSEGVKLKPGPEVEHTYTVSIPTVRKELAAHLKEFEDQMGRDFPSKPMALKNLQVVAIVQNQITKSYMQAKVVDVVEATADK